MSAEQNVPTTNASATISLLSVFWVAFQCSSPATSNAKKNKNWYSAFENAIVPSLMLVAIFSICFGLSGELLYSWVFHQVKIKSIIPKAGINKGSVSRFKKDGQQKVQMTEDFGE